MLLNLLCCFPSAVLQARLDRHTAKLAQGAPVVCLFVNDDCDAKVRSEIDIGVLAVSSTSSPPLQPVALGTLLAPYGSLRGSYRVSNMLEGCTCSSDWLPCAPSMEWHGMSGTLQLECVRKLKDVLRSHCAAALLTLLSPSSMICAADAACVSTHCLFFLPTAWLYISWLLARRALPTCPKLFFLLFCACWQGRRHSTPRSKPTNSPTIQPTSELACQRHPVACVVLVPCRL